MSGHVCGEAPASPIFPAERAMMTSRLQTERELWLTLSAAFLPPMAPATARAFRTELPDDLAALAEAFEIDVAEPLAVLRRSLAQRVDDETLLVHYSHLFLPPDIRARLNLCQYLDGTGNGAGRDALDNWYGHHEVAPRDDFHDLPDHLSMLLDFLAIIEDGEERTAFVRSFLLPALPRLAADIAGADAESPYLFLVSILIAALQPHVRTVDPGEARREEHRSRRRDTDLGVWRHCRTCGKPFAREKEIIIMTKALEQAGLPAEHLDTCPDCRELC